MAAAAEAAAPSEGPAGEGVEGDAASLPLLAAAAEEDEMVEEDVSVEEGLLLLRFLGEGPLR